MRASSVARMVMSHLVEEHHPAAGRRAAVSDARGRMRGSRGRRAARACAAAARSASCTRTLTVRCRPAATRKRARPTTPWRRSTTAPRQPPAGAATQVARSFTCGRAGVLEAVDRRLGARARAGGRLGRRDARRAARPARTRGRSRRRRGRRRRCRARRTSGCRAGARSSTRIEHGGPHRAEARALERGDRRARESRPEHEPAAGEPLRRPPGGDREQAVPALGDDVPVGCERELDRRLGRHRRPAARRWRVDDEQLQVELLGHALVGAHERRARARQRHRRQDVAGPRHRPRRAAGAEQPCARPAHALLLDHQHAITIHRGVDREEAVSDQPGCRAAAARPAARCTAAARCRPPRAEAGEHGHPLRRSGHQHRGRRAAAARGDREQAPGSTTLARHDSTSTPPRATVRATMTSFPAKARPPVRSVR